MLKTVYVRSVNNRSFLSYSNKAEWKLLCVLFVHTEWRNCKGCKSMKWPTYEYSPGLGLQSHCTQLICHAQETNNEQVHYKKGSDEPLTINVHEHLLCTTWSPPLQVSICLLRLVPLPHIISTVACVLKLPLWACHLLAITGTSAPLLHHAVYEDSSLNRHCTCLQR